MDVLGIATSIWQTYNRLFRSPVPLHRSRGTSWVPLPDGGPGIHRLYEIDTTRSPATLRQTYSGQVDWKSNVAVADVQPEGYQLHVIGSMGHHASERVEDFLSKKGFAYIQWTLEGAIYGQDESMHGVSWDRLRTYGLLHDPLQSPLAELWSKWGGATAFRENLIRIDTSVRYMSKGRIICVLLTDDFRIHESLLDKKPCADEEKNQLRAYTDPHRATVSNFEIPTGRFGRDRLSDWHDFGEQTASLQSSAQAHLRQFIDMLVPDFLPAVRNLQDSDWKALVTPIMLKYHRTGLLSLRYCLRNIERYYARPRDAMMDPGSLSLKETSLLEIMSDAYLYQALREQACDLSRTIGSVLDIVTCISDEVPLQNFHRFAAESRALSADTERIAINLEDRLKHHLKYLEHSRNLRESQILRRLSQLASVFLPLTLATGILSMQNRLRDIGSIFYDFCGVVLFLTGLTIIFFLVTRAIANIKSFFTKSARGTPGQQYLYRNKGIIALGYRALFVATLIMAIVSFALGSFQDIGLGLRVLGFGCAASSGILVITMVRIGLRAWVAEWNYREV